MAEKHVDITGRWHGEQLSTGLRHTNTEMQRLHLTARSFTSTAGLMHLALGKVGGIAAIGFSVYKAAKNVMEMDTAMIKLQNSGRLTATELPAWSEQIYRVAAANGFAAEKVAELSTEALKASHNTAFVSDQMDFMAKMANATGIPVGELGKYLGDVNRETGLTGDAFKEMMGKLAAMSTMTGVESDFAKLLPNMPALIRTYLQTNKGDIKGLSNYLGLAMFSPDPAQLNKNIQTLVRKMTPALRGALQLSKKDIETFDLQKIVGNIDKLAPDIEAKMGLLQQVFGKNSFNISYMTDHWKEFTEAVATGNLNTFLELAKNKSDSMASSFQSLATAGEHFADLSLGPAMKGLAEAIHEIPMDDVKALGEVFKVIGIVFGKAVSVTTDLASGFFRLGKISGAFLALVTGKASLKDYSAFVNENIAGISSSGSDIWEKSTDWSGIGDTGAEAAKKAETDAARAASSVVTPKITNQHNIKVYINNKVHKPVGQTYDQQMFIGAG